MGIRVEDRIEARLLEPREHRRIGRGARTDARARSGAVQGLEAQMPWDPS
jgi:hypothetical protein